MRLSVLSVSYPLAQVSFGTPGGAEQLLACPPPLFRPSWMMPPGTRFSSSIATRSDEH